MDYHFVRTSKKGSGTQNNFLKIIRLFAPLFVLALALPFLVGLVAAPPNLRFQTQANESSELRVWIEPASVILSQGESTTFTVFAQYDGDMLIPEIAFGVNAEGPVGISETSYKYSIPFNGRVELARVNLNAVSEGRATVTVPADSISITAFNFPLKISSGGANLIVR